MTKRKELPYVDMREVVATSASLIVALANDGAYRTAAARAKGLAAQLAAHVAYLDREGL